MGKWLRGVNDKYPATTCNWFFIQYTGHMKLAAKPSATRGALSNPPGRFETLHGEAAATAEDRETTLWPEPARSLISSNQSPDVPFEQSINPYRGCEHGCIYCFARPTHSYIGLSPGLDFETRLFYKKDAVKLLIRELSAPSYQCKPIAFGTNTDPYQPVERDKAIMRDLLQVLLDFRHPLTITTKGALILRDMDLLHALSRRRLVRVAVSLTTLSNPLKRAMEPRTAGPRARLKVIRRLQQLGIPVSVLVAPIIPFINDHELESLLGKAAEAGATHANWVMLRLPWEVKDLFAQWLEAHFPDRKERVLNTMRSLRDGKLYDADFATRRTGQGVFADLIDKRFSSACRKYGLNAQAPRPLVTERFKVPGVARQPDLFA